MKELSLKKQALITAGSSALMRAMGFGIRLWISRMLGAEALGVMELASGAHMLALTPAAAGLPSAVSRLTAKAENEEQKQLTLYAGRRAAICMGCLITPLFFFLSPLIAEALGDGRTLPALLFFAPCVLTVGGKYTYPLNLTVPAGGSAMLIYQAQVNALAPLAAGSTLTNTATVTGGTKPRLGFEA